MSKAQQGDTVKVAYRGTLSDGTEFDRSEEGEPLEFTIGDHQVISGFEDAAVGMEPGETKTVNIPASEAYGEHEDKLVTTVGRDVLPEDLTPEVGQKLQASTPNGQPLIVTVTEVTDTTLTLDANHELAGKDLTFEITMVSVG
jgi:peptidylprolyl isomerase